MPETKPPLLAVLIDADNIPARHAEPILKEITSFGEPALRRVYGDWSSDRLKPWADKVLALGMVAHQETANTKGKNASDIGLVIDAMDILHSGRFDGFVLVSSDSDFTRLASRIREEGLDVIGIGEAKTPVSLRNVCNRFVLIENIVEEPAPAAPRDKAQPPQPAVGKRPPQEVSDLIIRAMDKINQEDDWFTLGQIGQFITADNPDFDTRTYGKRKLSDLVRELKRFETKRVGNQLMVRRLD
ncbi:NYN domain-containing protein [Rhodovulum sp. BSW8]|uniref:NYN domain-containing protein n=1 Tax=Rhodovulum visakhapatnamense TaxID=364297 RepID=A0A4V3GV43_9RHOB|nr:MULTISPECIES: NYN domain-containing protein [Rhodovulum]OLS43347.1 Maebl [Rhodovulum sulfidophilum]MBL3569498.1 NYN domain-containing protein [Rhodovulum visakhapatnamense]MBL3579070.1 NYN domain-containing protein [Rhodovulum visakhapatnamense]RBO52300.1 NYN domain-containing protein [Rhodovulum sp. BSW8]TDX33372.1 OST-HTH/LOTUS domain-containing protein [Rhodovulum visakhapatnamense]